MAGRLVLSSYRALSLLACVAAVSGCTPARHAIEPLTIPGKPAEIKAPVFAVLGGSLLLAPVRVNGGPERLFLVDTGSPVCAVSPALARELWKTPKNAPTDRCVSLQWGPLNIPRVPVQVDRAADNGRRVQGILGCNVLAAFAQVEFGPFAARKYEKTHIWLRSMPSAGNDRENSRKRISARLLWYTGHPAASLRIGTAGRRRRVFFFIDSGAHAVTISPAIGRTFGDERWDARLTTSAGQLAFAIPELYLENVRLPNAVVSVDIMAGRASSKICRGSGLLGMSVLARGKTVIDFQNNRFIFDPSPGSIDPVLPILEAAYASAECKKHAGGRSDLRADEKEIDRHVKRLASDRWSERRAAMEHLIGVYRLARPHLKEATRSEEPMVSSRAEALLLKCGPLGWLGLEYRQRSADDDSSAGPRDGRGVVVVRVFQGSPAEKAGLKPGDILYSAGGTVINGRNKLAEIVGNTPPGTQLNISIYRHGRKKELKVTVGLSERWR